MIKLLKTLLFTLVIVAVYVRGARCFVVQSMQEAMSFNNAAEGIRIEKEEIIEQHQSLPDLHSIYKQAMLPSFSKTPSAEPKVLNFLEDDVQAIKIKQGETFQIVLPQTMESKWNVDVPKNLLTIQGSRLGDNKITYELRADSQGKGMFFMDNVIKEDAIQSKILRFWIMKP